MEEIQQKPKHKTLYQFILVLFLSPVLAFAIWCGCNIHSYSHERSVMRKDYSELNNIKYGLLSVDSWKTHIIEIVDMQIQQFDFSPQQEDTLKKELNKVLGALVAKAEKMVNKKQTTFKGKITKFAVNNFVDVDA